MLKVDDQIRGKIVEAKLGEHIEICLPENPTTGYRWVFKQTGEPVCTLLADHFEPGAKVAGGPGMHHWQFKVTAEGTAEIELAYSRSWESAAGASRTFDVRITTKEQPAAPFQ